EHFQPFAQLLDYSERHQAVNGKGIAFQLLQFSQVDDGPLLLENVGKPAFGQAAVQGHLAAFEPALLAEAGAGMLALGAARRSLAVSRAHAAANALAAFLLSGGRFQS